MHPRVMRVLEFNKVKEQLLEHVSSSLGRDRAENLMPSTDFNEVVQLQEETDEAVNVLRLKGNVPLGGIFDIRAHIKRAVIGGMLSPLELMQVASTVHTSRQMKRFIDDTAEEGHIPIPILEGLAEQIIVLADLEQSIKNAIDDNGVGLDSASDALRSLRNQLRTKEARVREKLESMIRSSSAQKMLSDALITIRNDRFVLPVKQEYRSHYGGIIHDTSSSGQTLFIEPQAIVQLNNELQGIRVEEQQEILRILISLSAQVGEFHSELETIVKILTQLDFMFAKARYANRLKA
jgi:DNA mismatch repair protein MutS2